jgi:hypothetical protein
MNPAHNPVCSCTECGRNLIADFPLTPPPPDAPDAPPPRPEALRAVKKVALLSWLPPLLPGGESRGRGEVGNWIVVGPALLDTKIDGAEVAVLVVVDRSSDDVAAIWWDRATHSMVMELVDEWSLNGITEQQAKMLHWRTRQ